MPKHLFICGCPRSGTTLLTELINAHPDIAVGVERYGTRFFSEPLTPALFEASRFYDVREGDTFYSSLDFSPIYERKRARFDKMAWIGDKIPLLYQRLSALEGELSEAKVIFCFRNIIDVAASFQARRDNPEDATWSPELDGSAAVALWNKSIEAYLSLRPRLRTFVFRQDTFAQDGQEQMRALVRWLGLEWDEHVERSVAGHQVMSERLTLKRTTALTESAKREICENAMFDGYRRIIRQQERRREQVLARTA